ncbi:hypothetical protein [Fusibacter ferrireducens]|uniref:SMODS and SLOG-associating 2TM effector domain-containing protein n=1 Tax=Fusibacter ferrireducens TaxID=2785058 RepID=A0ABS0A080_9FIRM|nr:hypothetical protein [Fusibacter ferrireducens]MBF4696095.1 hypothetical protein [Fusibacter ferrireducens]
MKIKLGLDKIDINTEKIDLNKFYISYKKFINIINISAKIIVICLILIIIQIFLSYFSIKNDFIFGVTELVMMIFIIVPSIYIGVIGKDDYTRIYDGVFQDYLKIISDKESLNLKLYFYIVENFIRLIDKLYISSNNYYNKTFQYSIICSFRALMYEDATIPNLKRIAFYNPGIFIEFCKQSNEFLSKGNDELKDFEIYGEIERIYNNLIQTYNENTQNNNSYSEYPQQDNLKKFNEKEFKSILLILAILAFIYIFLFEKYGVLSQTYYGAKLNKFINMYFFNGMSIVLLSLEVMRTKNKS